MALKSIEELDISSKALFLRLDLNVPLCDGKITDETRITAALPTIRYAIDKGAKIVLASHMGRPKTEADREKLSLQPVAERLSEILDAEIILVENPSGDAPKGLLGGLRPKQIILLENLRFEDGETKNDKDLYEEWAKYTQVYVNDAFGASHRAHASIVGLPGVIKEKGIGFLIKKEMDVLDKVLNGKEYSFVAVLGGAKVSDKISVIESLVNRVDTMIIGGAMAYTFLAAQGISIGNSLVEKDKLHVAKALLERFRMRGKELILPYDHVTVESFEKTSSLATTSGVEIPEGVMAVDIGPKTIANYVKKISQAATVFWNGPMGVFETPEYAKGTFAIAKSLAENEKLTIVGGGDSAAAISLSGYSDQVSHVSTGGGASLEYLQGKNLPGIEALKC